MKIRNLALAAFVAVFAACNNGENSSDPAMDQESTDMEMTEETPIEDDSNDALMVPEGARLFFANIEDGAELTSPVHVEMGIEGMDVVPAGELVSGTGHHHIIINKGHISKGDVIPADEQHIHYGGGQTSADLDLEPGQYTLTLQFANGLHQSYGEQMSASVEITVK